MKTVLITFSFMVLIFSCQEKSKNTMALNGSTQNDAVEVLMEGNKFGIAQKNLEGNKARISNDSILFELWQDGNPLKLNLNLFNTGILSQGTATYTFPDANSGKIKVDLNLYNGDRDVKNMNKRIIFRKGTITISKITDKELHMTFEGEGSGVLEYGNNFPISGKVDITY